MASKTEFKALGYGLFIVTGEVQVVNLDEADLMEDELASKYPGYDGYIVGYDTRNYAFHVVFKGDAKKLADIENATGMMASLVKLPDLTGYTVKHADDVTAVYSKNDTHVVIAFDND